MNAFVADIVTPIIAAIGGNPDFSSLSFHLNGSVFLYGSFLNALITFLSIAAVVFFFVVKPVSAASARRAPAEGEPVERECPECMSIIPSAARHCSHCTSEVTPATA